MLTTQTNVSIENDILPTQNIGLLDPNQSQIYSLLPNLNPLRTTKEIGRKRPTKLDETQPVTINPNIARIPVVCSYPMPNHYPTINHRTPCKVYLGSNSHDTNNNIAQNIIGGFPVSLNSPLSVQMRSNKDSLPIVNNQNGCVHYESPLRMTDQDLFSSSSSSSISSIKPKRKYTKKQQQQQQPSNGLPSIIPTSINPTEEHSRSLNIPLVNCLPLSPPSSIQSSPTNIISDSSIQPRHFLSTQKMITKPDSRYFQQLLAAPHPQYGLIPIDFLSKGILPIGCSSMTPTDSRLIEMERENQERQSKNISKPFVECMNNGEPLHSRLSTGNKSSVKKSKTKVSSAKDIQTKKQLRRMARRNRLAVLKFMIQKRKQQKQKLVSSSTSLSTNDEQLVTKTIKPTLPDIIASNLKITFDATKQIESISLSYNRQCKPECMHENTSISNNSLGLLIEAMELVESTHK